MADRLRRLVRHDDAVVEAVREVPEVPAALIAEDPVRMASGVAPSSATVRMPSRPSSSPVFSPTPHSRPTGSGSRNARTPSWRHDEHAVGLGTDRSELRHELRRRDADRADDADLVARRGLGSRRDPGRVSEQRVAPTSRNASSSESGSTSGVYDSRISRKRFECARYASKSRGRKIAWGTGASRGPGIAEWMPERAGLVAGGRDDAARAVVADHDRLAARDGSFRTSTEA